MAQLQETTRQGMPHLNAGQAMRLREAIETLKTIDYHKVQHSMGELQDGVFAVDVTVCGSGCVNIEREIDVN